MRRANDPIYSTRLSLRPVGEHDVDALHAIMIEEPVRRFLWDGDIIPHERTREIVEKSMALFDEQRFGLWGVRERGEDELIGFAGYWHFRTPPSLELLFGVAPDHWNRGIATESARLLIQYAFDELGFRAVDASTDAGNAASVRVLEKLGMALRRRAVVDGLDTVFFTMTRENWEAAIDH